MILTGSEIQAEYFKWQDAEDVVCDFPEWVAQAVEDKVAKWGDKECPHYDENDSVLSYRRMCGLCWREFINE